MEGINFLLNGPFVKAQGFDLINLDSTASSAAIFNNTSGDIALSKGSPNCFASLKAGMAPRTNSGFFCQ
jgi:hypothetical protein